ncbi:MAG: type I glyceraldehyde-3-phosphate dehydrogenase [Candidatus Taylorbacteria bacterium]|nr:type I glyceraldehyde-3-phosphate dehydrogenase [Candidatus Taylorbacteria bacterium]
MTKKVAINGAGRIGRAFLKLASEQPELEVVAINDLADIGNIAYLMKYDSAYGRSNLDIKADKEKNILIINGKEVQYLSEKDPVNLPWAKLGVDIVLESTGLFTSYEKSSAHIKAGAKRVVISAPSKDDAGKPEAVTVLMGVNPNDISKCEISSNASCTTNAISPVISILNEKIGIEKAILNTTHAYTASQALVDAPNKKDWREGRAAAMNMAPSTTGAAIATAKVITDLKGKFDGIAVRVPVVTGSIADVTFISKRPTTVEEVNTVLKEAAQSENWKGIFDVTEEELVSRDIVGNPHASIADLKMTKVVDGNLVKVLAWYDNEGGYTHALVRHVVEASKLL